MPVEPRTVHDLPSTEAHFDRLPDDSESGAPCTVEQVIEFMDRDGTISPLPGKNDFHFQRTAAAPGRRYWVWIVNAGGATYDACVCHKDNGDVCIGFTPRLLDWNVEQYILGDINDLFYDHWYQVYTMRW